MIILPNSVHICVEPRGNQGNNLAGIIFRMLLAEKKTTVHALWAHKLRNLWNTACRVTETVKEKLTIKTTKSLWNFHTKP